MIQRSPYSVQHIPVVSVVEFIFEHADQYADKPALIDGVTGRGLTYGVLIDRIRRTADGLIARGYKKGDVCAIYSPNMPEYAVVFYAIAMAGGIVTTINPLYSVTELTHQLRDSAARCVITTSRLLAKVRQSVPQTAVRDIFTIDETKGVTPISALQDSPSGARVALDPTSDVVVLPYSSGTTGLPKGVMLTHYNIVANVQQTAAVEGIARNEVLIATLPFYHIYGMVVVMHQGLRAGATLVTLSQFRARTFLDIIQKYEVTTAYLVPPLVRTLATAKTDSHDLSSLKDIISAAAPLPENTARACAARSGCNVRQVYGLTEASPVTHITPRGRLRLNAVGIPVPSTECRIVGVARRVDVKPGELGEVWVRGPQVMKGYLNDPEATRTMVDGEGWLHTGDIGFTDRDGYLYVVDRAKELTKFRGLHYGEQELLRSMVEEIAARRTSGERLKFQALLLDSVRESVVATDVSHHVTFWNRGAELLFGYRNEEAIGQPIDLLIIPTLRDARTRWEAELADVIAVGKWQGQALRRRQDGLLFWTDIVVSLVADTDGAPSGFIAIHRDITELRRKETMLIESEQQLRNLASRLMVVRETERSAIARELHDELGQSLTRLKIDLRWLTDRLPAALKPKRVMSMPGLIDNMVGTVQHISAQLRPAILDDLGLEAAIESHVQDFGGRTGCRYKLDLNLAGLKPSGDRDTAVFRILQEAITNVARHANAKFVAVRAQVRAGTLIVEIEDDGVGIPEMKWTNPHSLGIVGMRERAESLGGRLEVCRGDDRGTVVTVSIPIDRLPPPQTPSSEDL